MCCEKRGRDNNHDSVAGEQQETIKTRKKLKSSTGAPVEAVADGGQCDFFYDLHDDIVLSILAKLASIAGCPVDFISVLLTYKRLNGLALHSLVLSKASPKTFVAKAKNWSESSHRFLKLCSDAGNVEACYTLGMMNEHQAGIVERLRQENVGEVMVWSNHQLITAGA